MVLINLVTTKVASANVTSFVPSSYKSLVSLTAVVATDAETIGVESSDDENISYEKMAHSYKVMYEKLVDIVKKNKVMNKKISLLCSEENKLFKQNNVLKNELFNQRESLNKLEQIKKTMCMMNYGTTTFNQILVIGKGKKK